MAKTTLDHLLIDMLEHKGSDLHLAVNAVPKMRIDGLIHSMDADAINAEDLNTLLQDVVPEHRWEHFTQTGDVDLAHEISGRARFRMNVFRNSHGNAAVLRQIPSNIASIDELGLPAVLKEVAEYRHGLVLVTGPTGSGKSTTLAAIIDHINSNFQKEIITLEDPVEFTHQDKRSTILHREVGQHTQDFSKGLRGVVRADTDVVLIGEMRDLTTIRAALSCAAMGMLVFATVHTNDAIKTIDRIIDAFPAAEQNQTRTMLGDCLQAVISQLLCQKKDGGRIPVHEILLKHASLGYCIRKGSLSNIRSIIEQSGSAGMISMDASIRKLLNAGQITQNEAYMKAIQKEQFQPST